MRHIAQRIRENGNQSPPGRNQSLTDQPFTSRNTEIIANLIEELDAKKVIKELTFDSMGNLREETNMEVVVADNGCIGEEWGKCPHCSGWSENSLLLDDYATVPMFCCEKCNLRVVINHDPVSIRYGQTHEFVSSGLASPEDVKSAPVSGSEWTFSRVGVLKIVGLCGSNMIRLRLSRESGLSLEEKMEVMTTTKHVEYSEYQFDQGVLDRLGIRTLDKEALYNPESPDYIDFDFYQPDNPNYKRLIFLPIEGPGIWAYGEERIRAGYPPALNTDHGGCYLPFVYVDRDGVEKFGCLWGD